MAKHLEAEGKIVYSKTGMPRVLRPVEESKGSQLQDVGTDIDKDYPRIQILTVEGERTEGVRAYY